MSERAMNEPVANAPGIGTLLGSLVNETGMLVRQEIHLASTEMGQKAKTAALELQAVALGGLLVHVGLLSLVAAVVLGLGTLIPMWISALILGALAVIGGGALVYTGLKSLKAVDPVPQRTIQTLQQDKVWMKEQFR